jgi:hypothetical protein
MSEAYTVISVVTEITVILARCQDSSFRARNILSILQKMFADLHPQARGLLAYSLEQRQSGFFSTNLGPRRALNEVEAGWIKTKQPDSACARQA